MCVNACSDGVVGFSFDTRDMATFKAAGLVGVITQRLRRPKRSYIQFEWNIASVVRR